jgi:endoglucanase Acf2
VVKKLLNGLNTKPRWPLPYFYNKSTETEFVGVDELKNCHRKITSSQSLEEQAEDGKTYYHNTTATKRITWSITEVGRNKKPGADEKGAREGVRLYNDSSSRYPCGYPY